MRRFELLLVIALALSLVVTACAPPTPEIIVETVVVTPIPELTLAPTEIVRSTRLDDTELIEMVKADERMSALYDYASESGFIKPEGLILDFKDGTSVFIAQLLLEDKEEQANLEFQLYLTSISRGAPGEALFMEIFPNTKEVFLFDMVGVIGATETDIKIFYEDEEIIIWDEIEGFNPEARDLTTLGDWNPEEIRWDHIWTECRGELVECLDVGKAAECSAKYLKCAATELVFWPWPFH